MFRGPRCLYRKVIGFKTVGRNGSVDDVQRAKRETSATFSSMREFGNVLWYFLHGLTTSAANASGFLQVPLSKIRGDFAPTSTNMGSGYFPSRYSVAAYFRNMSYW